MRSLRMALPLLAALAPLPAAAHAILLESQPPSGATVAPGDQRVTLRFNSRIDAGRSRVEVRGAAPAPATQDAAAPAPTAHVTAGPTPDTLVAEVALPPGEWTLRWQVLAVDGHITRGDVPLVVKAP